MYPIPTARAAWLFAAVSLGALVAIGMGSAVALAIATAGWLVLGVSLVRTIPLGRRLRRQRLELAWWLDASSSDGAAVAGVPFQVRCFARHRGDEALDVERLEPLMSPGAEWLDLKPVRIVKGARTAFTLQLRAAAAGRVVLHGLALEVRGPLGLFRTPLFFPNPLAIRVLPRSGRLRGKRSALGGAAGSGKHAARGGGTDLHELREFVPGDAFKAIAWKASARRGRLIVREMEQELQQTTQIIVDTSSSMRGGRLGERKLDRAVEVAATMARRAIRGGERVALYAFDGRITVRLPPDEGHGQLIRIFDGLMSEMEVVDADRTSLSEGVLTQLVADYCRQQDGIDFGRGDRINDEALLKHVRRFVSTRGATILAKTSASRALRRFCLERGLPLPAREDTPASKAQALSQALKTAGARAQDPSAIVLITDFDGIPSAEPLEPTLRMVRRHGHTLHVLLAQAQGGRTGDALATIYQRSEQRRLTSARRALARAGARVEVQTP